MKALARARWLVLLVLPVLPVLLLAGGVQAQSSACDELTTRLATRIESTGVRGYSLEVVPAAAPVPRDGKVIGTCEAGVYKVVYRRWGGTAAAGSAPAASAASPASPASVLVARPAPSPPPKPEPAPPSRPVIEPAPPARAPEPASAPAATVAEAAAPPASAPQPEPSASLAQAAASAVAPAAGGGAWAARGWLVRIWPWLAAVLVLLVGAWAWRSRSSGYDKSGLPRGPRL